MQQDYNVRVVRNHSIGKCISPEFGDLIREIGKMGGLPSVGDLINVETIAEKQEVLYRLIPMEKNWRKYGARPPTVWAAAPLNKQGS